MDIDGASRTKISRDRETRLISWSAEFIVIPKHGSAMLLSEPLPALSGALPGDLDAAVVSRNLHLGWRRAATHKAVVTYFAVTQSWAAFAEAQSLVDDLDSAAVHQQSFLADGLPVLADVYPVDAIRFAVSTSPKVLAVMAFPQSMRSLPAILSTDYDWVRAHEDLD